MARETKRRSHGRRSPWAAAALIGIGLLLTGGVYAGASAAMASTADTTASTALTVDDGKKLFQANCATCHGLDVQGTEDGPSLYDVCDPVLLKYRGGDAHLGKFYRTALSNPALRPLLI